MPPVDLVFGHPAARQPVRGVDDGDRHLGCTTWYAVRARHARGWFAYGARTVGGPPARAARRRRHVRCAGGRDAHSACVRHGCGTARASRVSTARRLELGAVAAGGRVALDPVLRSIAQRGGRGPDTTTRRGHSIGAEYAGCTEYPVLPGDDDRRPRRWSRGAALLAGFCRS